MTERLDTDQSANRARALLPAGRDTMTADISSATGYRFPIPPHPIAAEQARVLVRIALTAWDRDDLTDDALIIVTELATNAMKCGDVFHLALSRHDGNVLIEVTDPSEALPKPQPRSLDRIDGRGLLLVEGCSKDWGWRTEESGGKTVWALVGTPGTPTTPDQTAMSCSAIRI